MLVSILLRDPVRAGLRGLFPMSLRTLPVSVEYRYYPMVALYSLAMTDSHCISGTQSALTADYIALRFENHLSDKLGAVISICERVGGDEGKETGGAGHELVISGSKGPMGEL